MISDPDAVRKVLEKKLEKYIAEGHDAAAANVQHILEHGPEAVAATFKVDAFTKNTGSTRKIKLVDRPKGKKERQLYDNPRTVDRNNIAEVLQRAADDPVYAADLMHSLRRPRRVDRAKHEISGRAAVRQPMLNGPKDSLESALKYREPDVKTRVPKLKREWYMIVKPASLQAARAETGASNWVERRWDVYSLKYAPGFVIVTDKGAESRTFPSRGELLSAVTKSGWEIVR